MAERAYYDITTMKDFAFNSVNNDRLYDANDLCDWLRPTTTNGVCSTPQDQLKVIPGVGMNVSVSIGVGLINGHSFRLKEPLTIAIDSASGIPSGYSRIDNIIMRVNNIDRRVELFYSPGVVSTTPVANALIQDIDGDYYELCIAEVTVSNGTTSIGGSNINNSVKEDASKCGFVVSTATIFTPYSRNIQVTSTRTSFEIELQSFNSDIDIITIEVNGIKLNSNQYSISGRTVTLYNPVYANNTITYDIWHFFDASAILSGTVADTQELVNKVNNMYKYYYVCNGNTDNVLISSLAQDFLNGAGTFAGTDVNAQMELIICGNLGVSGIIGGAGTQADPKYYFNLGKPSTSTRTIYFNFGNCTRISMYTDTTVNNNAIIFKGADINIRNLSILVNTGYIVSLFNGEKVHIQDSEFWANTTNNIYGCIGDGTFENCRFSLTSSTGSAFCFYGDGALTRVIGGEYYCWTGSAGNGKEAVVFYVEAYQTTNKMLVTMANCPTYTRSGYSQTSSVKINHGYATITACTLFRAVEFYSTATCKEFGNILV